MRYFRRTNKPAKDEWSGKNYPSGMVLSERQLPDDFNGNAYWEEVIVTPKPQPKKYKERVAVFSDPHHSSSYGKPFCMSENVYVHYKYIYPYNIYKQLSEWVEVEFTERSDQLSTDCEVV